MARRSKEDAAETREQILSAALHVFSEKGYSRTTFVDIAKEIGLSKGAVYWHFKSKPELLAAVISQRKKQQCSRVMDAQPSSVAELREAILTTARQVADDREIQKFEFFCGFQIEWSTELLVEVHEKLAELRGDPLEEFEKTLTYLQDIGELDTTADVEMLARSMASIWMGALHLTLHGQLTFDYFIQILEQNFDLVIGCCSSR